MSSIALNDKQVYLYDSPYSSRGSCAATGASKINHAVAQRNYSAKSIIQSINTEAVPVVDKSHSQRYQEQPLGESYKTSVIQAKENYETHFKINDHYDFIDQLELETNINDKVMKNMILHSDTTIKHKIFGTDLPIWYITNIIFFTLIEQEYAKTYAPNDTKVAFKTPNDVCDMMYDIYMKESYDVKELETHYKKFLNDTTDVSQLSMAINKLDVANLKESDPAYYPIMILATAFQFQGELGTQLLKNIGITNKYSPTPISLPACIDLKLNLPKWEDYKGTQQKDDDGKMHDTINSRYENAVKNRVTGNGVIKTFENSMVPIAVSWASWCAWRNIKVSEMKDLEGITNKIDEALYNDVTSKITEDIDNKAKEAEKKLKSSGVEMTDNDFGLFYTLMKYLQILCSYKGYGQETFESPIDVVILDSEKAPAKYVVSDDAPTPTKDFIPASVFEKVIKFDRAVSDEISRRIYGTTGMTQTPIAQPVDENAQVVEAFGEEEESCWKLNDPHSWWPILKPLRLSSRHVEPDFHRHINMEPESSIEAFTDRVHKTAEITSIVCIVLLIAVYVLFIVFFFIKPYRAAKKATTQPTPGVATV